MITYTWCGPWRLSAKIPGEKYQAKWWPVRIRSIYIRQGCLALINQYNNMTLVMVQGYDIRVHEACYKEVSFHFVKEILMHYSDVIMSVMASNHQPHDCLLKRLFRPRSKKTSKLRLTGLCDRNSPVTGEFPTQRASKVENVSFWWHHHGIICLWRSLVYCYDEVWYTVKPLIQDIP